MTVTEVLYSPLLAADPARPLITHYDDALGSRVELSRATMANWAAKTANWLRDEHDVGPGDPVAVLLPAHWQTVGVLLGAWWCGARVTDQADGASVAVVAPGGAAEGADVVAVASLDPMGRGLDERPAGTVDYLDDVRAHGDRFDPGQRLPGDTPALLASTVDEVVAEARSRAETLGITGDSRVLSTMEWTMPDGLFSGLLAVLAAGASLVQCSHADVAGLPARRSAENVTISLGGPTTG
ncbi:TIGR03089 family protein [Goodfellowiella coeruleoviolacea]|uniref:TIGR03089 family protein n=1 Tax=Goodfellowiella coeruleoviolacea TaxID=334858 RepID=A0AAE3GMI1_9PSEU|nr:TIGR03089 family protein [Goodfellowiella coeruleoviolacea]MCP2170004.1 TIGR03089 family protein [Goodfellowiella coeruleoviolacea]